MPSKTPPCENLQALTAEICACRACPRLVSWREQIAAEKRRQFQDQTYWGRPVPGFGDPDARLILIGLAPAAHGANRTGRMFTGDRSGQWLYRALWKAGFANQATSESRDDGLRLSDCWVSAAVRCAPPQNKPQPQEIAACRGFLEREFALLQRARVIVALGRLGFEAACALLAMPSPRPTFSHGAVYSAPNDRALIASYHPSQQNTFTGRLTESMFDAVFQRARDALGPR